VQNNINDLCADSIAKLVETCDKLQVLVLYWNYIKNYGGSCIMKKIKAHVELKVVDFSWNRLGSNLLDEPTKEEMESQYQNKDGTLNFFNAEINEIKVFMEFNSKKRLKPLKSSISLFAKETGEMFKNTNSEIIHFDISHNNINFIDCNYLSKNLNFYF
jgi:hypothetical protein